MITSVNNEKIKFYNSLKQKKNIIKNNLFLVEGKHLIDEALKKDLVYDILSLDDNYKDRTLVSDNVICKLSHLKNHQNHIAVVKVKENDIEYNSNILLIDNIKDPGNLGTIIRTAVSFNYKNIIIGNNSVNIYNSKVIRASEGMIFNINYRYNELNKEINDLKNKGYKIYASSLDDSEPLNSIKKKEKHALIIGSEAQGISNELLNISDKKLKINIDKSAESLNAAVAAGILMFYLGDL